jgi:hypothetical protein
MSDSFNLLTATRNRGRTFFICALLLLAVMLFEPIASSFASGTSNFGNSAFTSIIYTLVLIAAFRGGVLSLKIIKGCLGICAAILCVSVLLIGIGAAAGKNPAPRIEWDMRTLRAFASFLPLLYIYWALYFSKSVKAFVTYQRDHFHAREMQKIQETKSNFL